MRARPANMKGGHAERVSLEASNRLYFLLFVRLSCADIESHRDGVASNKSSS